MPRKKQAYVKGPQLPALFEALHASLKRLTDGEVAPPVVKPPTPAVSVASSSRGII